MREKLIDLIMDLPITRITYEEMEKYSEVVADYLIANGVTIQEWIPVGERLPTREDADETESILAINKDEKYVGRWIWDSVVRWPTEFTHWMPMPEPPKEDQ